MGIRKSVNFLHLKDATREGKRHIYSLLKGRGRLLLVIKLVLMTLKYMQLKSDKKLINSSLVFINGINQQRLYANYKNKLLNEIGEHDVIFFHQVKYFSITMVVSNFFSIIKLFSLAAMLLITGRRRNLNEMLANLIEIIGAFFDSRLLNIENFVCFNDQPFDMAYLNKLFDCRSCVNTVVIQHGLILTPRFYFPINAKQFWSWGENAKIKAPKGSLSKFIIHGRYLSDSEKKSEYFNIGLSKKDNVKILIAPSFSYSEIFKILKKIKNIIQYNKASTEVYIKLHPATKMQSFLKVFISLQWKELRFENNDMEVASDIYDCLFTKNSTSAIDFLLRGKPVYFSELKSNDFPCKTYGFTFEDYSDKNCDASDEVKSIAIHEKNESRLKLIYGELNV